ncbi:MAG: hypothetical protein RL758_90 [Pseudomonadota bacterium]|jgi:hypothetical protein
MNHIEATQYIKATLAAFGPGDAMGMTIDTWAKLHEAMSVLIGQPAQKPQQEPVAWDGDCVLGHCGSPAGCEASNCCRADYTTPPQRKPLTDEQIDAAIKAWFENDIVAGRQPFAKRMRAAFAAAHGIKGGA